MTDFWNRIYRPFDKPLLICILALLFTGLLVMYSSSTVTAMREFGDPEYYLKRQSAWIVISLLLFVTGMSFPYRLLEKYSTAILVFSTLMLVVVFVPGVGKSVGTHYGRSFHRWISIGPFQFQPSEFAKLAVIIYLSVIFKNLDLSRGYRQFAMPAALIGLNLGLILYEPAFGTMIEIVFVVIFLVYLSGISIKNLIYTAIASLPLVLLLVLKVGYRKKRIDVWLDPYKYRYDEGHQLVSSFKAFMDGGWTGNPLASGYSHRYLAYSHTDFVMATFAEDFGYLGFLFLFSLFLFLVFRSVFLVKRVNDRFGMFLASGIFSLITIQILINMYVVTGIFPVTGISLPFISYGGSSLIMIMLSLGIFFNITRYENIAE